MSTYWRLRCLAHTPALESDDEVSQHTDEYLYRAMGLANCRPVECPELGPTEYDGPGPMFERNARRFLAEHPTCGIEAVSEYGDRRPVAYGVGLEAPTTEGSAP